MKNKWLDKLNNNPIPWLLDSNPWTRYNTLINLLEKPLNSDEVIKAGKSLYNDKKIITLINETKNWFNKSFTRHNAPNMTHYKLRMLCDFGFTIDNEDIKQIVDKVHKHMDNDLFAVRQELPEKVFKKSDPYADTWYALPCDSPIITYILYKLGCRDEKVLKSVDIIKSKWDSQKGWFCNFFFVISQFNKLQIGCPMAGIMALEVFSLLDELKEAVFIKNAYAPVLFHKDCKKIIYYFGRSKKFWAFKYPFIWYNALYLADVLTRFNNLKNSDVVKELINWIINSQDEAGRFKPSSIFMIYKDWDFGNKKEASPWITYLCCRILKRYYNG